MIRNDMRPRSARRLRSSSKNFEIALVLVRLDGVASRIAATEKRFVVRADEKLTAFLELEAAIRTGSAARHSLAERG
jgi:hypothetical protein